MTQITAACESYDSNAECEGSLSFSVRLPPSLSPSLIGFRIVLMMSEAERLPWRWAPWWHFERKDHSRTGLCTYAVLHNLRESMALAPKIRLGNEIITLGYNWKCVNHGNNTDLRQLMAALHALNEQSYVSHLIPMANFCVEGLFLQPLV